MPITCCDEFRNFFCDAAANRARDTGLEQPRWQASYDACISRPNCYQVLHDRMKQHWVDACAEDDVKCQSAVAGL